MDVLCRFKCDVCGEEYDYKIPDAMLINVPPALDTCGGGCFGTKVLEWAWYDLPIGFKWEMVNWGRSLDAPVDVPL